MPGPKQRLADRCLAQMAPGLASEPAGPAHGDREAPNILGVRGGEQALRGPRDAPGRHHPGGTAPSLSSARWWKPPQLPQKIIDMTRPITPTTMRMTPTVWILNPGVLTVTAKSRIAPTAIRKMLVPRPIPPSLVSPLVSEIAYLVSTRNERRQPLPPSAAPHQPPPIRRPSWPVLA